MITTIEKGGRPVRLIPKNTVSTPKPKQNNRKRAIGYWTPERFDQATAGGRNTRSKRAARRHLVDGLTQDAAAAEAGITRASLACTLNRIRHAVGACPTCGHALPHATVTDPASPQKQHGHNQEAGATPAHPNPGL